MKHIKKIILVASLVALYGAIWHFNLHKAVTLDHIKSYREFLTNYVHDHYVRSLLCYIAFYFFDTAFAIPGSFLIAMVGGFLFGPIVATLCVVIGATLGGTTSFLMTRYLIGRSIQKKYAQRLKDFNAHLAHYGVRYLLILRLFPFFPFVLANILAGLTRLPVFDFMWTTAVGIIPVVFVYATLGREVMMINELKELLSPMIIGALSVLALLSIISLLWNVLYMRKRVTH